jgi:D-sedoheptulose 7-phosphate isomerase
LKNTSLKDKIKGLSKAESLSLIRQRLGESAALKEKVFREDAGTILAMAEAMASVLRKGGKILLCGNGGSAADAQHIAAELVVRLQKLERRALPVLSLATNTSALTAEGNDHGFETIFSRQVEAFGGPGDLLIAISTSGNSPNILRAAVRARKLRMKVLGMTGEGGGKLAKFCDLLFAVPEKHTARVQEVHITAGHIACELIEHSLFGES